ncbi:hypothetical protein I79_014174 [Cricetulus griseus]|uniref:Uncharacterized protein n=1 Tax=Cricetulus griseus TaxID=10029 RepID=G3HTE9_CRIGR|nr:hypothetical protein I79_014174 [Cricetulus griseus]
MAPASSEGPLPSSQPVSVCQGTPAAQRTHLRSPSPTTTAALLGTLGPQVPVVDHTPNPWPGLF